LFNDKADFSDDMALRIEKAFGVTTVRGGGKWPQGRGGIAAPAWRPLRLHVLCRTKGALRHVLPGH
jgi:hypothetical protein